MREDIIDWIRAEYGCAAGIFRRRSSSAGGYTGRQGRRAGKSPEGIPVFCKKYRRDNETI